MAPELAVLDVTDGTLVERMAVACGAGAPALRDGLPAD
jgi:hypothetical protein